MLIKRYVVILPTVILVTASCLHRTLATSHNNRSQPSISAYCAMHWDITPKSPEEYVSAARIEYTWAAEDADFVEIIGLDDQHHPLKGSFFGSESYLFVAHSDEGVAFKPLACRSERSTGPVHGRWGMVIKAREYVAWDEVLGSAFVYHLSTKESLETVARETVEALQDQKFITRETLFCLPKSKCLFTPASNYHPLACKGDDCGKEPGSQRIQRQVAFFVVLTDGESVEGAHEVKIAVSSEVVQRYRLGSSDWRADPDEQELAIMLSRSLTTRIQSRLDSTR